LTELQNKEDAFLNIKEQLIEPVGKFMAGSQKEIYQQAKAFINDQDANFSYVEGDEDKQIRTVLADPACFKGNRIQQLKTQLDDLKKEVDKKVKEVRSQAATTLKQMRSRMQRMDEYKALPDVRTHELDSSFEKLTEYINQQKLIAVINDRMRYFEETGYQKLLTQMVEMASRRKVGEEKVEYISTRKINVSFDKAWLASDTDVDEYLEKLREALLVEIQKGKRIQI